MISVQRLIATLCLPLLLLPAASSMSQSEDTAEAATQDDSIVAEDKAAKKKAKPEAEAKSKKDAAEIFIPSEEISEDLSVSFPVDI